VSPNAVPSGSWYVSSWATYAYGNSVSFLVYKPGAVAGTYDVIAESPVETLPPTQTESTFPAYIPVQPGDLIGLWQGPGDLDGCYTHATGNGLPQGFAAGVPTVGSVLTLATTGFEDGLDLSATLSPLTPSAVCGVTEGLVTGSAAYEHAPFLSRAFANLLTVGACLTVDQFSGSPSDHRRAAAIAAYEGYVATLVEEGWLTPAQGAELDALAGDL
jgi:hypothetical protein